MQNINIKDYLILLVSRRERKAKRGCGGPVPGGRTMNLMLESLGFLNTTYPADADPPKVRQKVLLFSFQNEN